MAKALKQLSKPKLSERDIRRQVCDYLKLRGYFYWYNLQGLGSYLGLCDLFLLYEGKIFGIEFKDSRGRQSEKQKHFELNFTNNGGFYVLIKSFEDFREFEELYLK